MRRRIWVFVLFCLFVVSLLFSQLTNATAGLRLDEAATRFLLAEGRTGASLVVENPLGQALPARVRVELLDPRGTVRASNEREELIKEGRSTLFIALRFQFSDLKSIERNEFLWYRLRYVITPKDAANESAGFISLSNITPDIFEVRVAASEFGREGALYRAHLRAVHPISGNAIEGVRVEASLKVEEDEGEKEIILKFGGVTNADGYATLNFALPRGIRAEGAEINVTARRGIFIQEARDTIHFDYLSRIFISTDKPLYQPGQTLHARALYFSPSMQAIAGADMPFKITDPEGTTVYRAMLKTSRFGAASADWVIPENTRLGDYTLSFGRDDASAAFYRVRISRYDLPNFVANAKPDRPFYLPGQNAKVEVSAAYLFGQPVKRGHVRVVRETEREWNYREQKWEIEEADKYEGETDAEGRFIAHVKLEEAHEDLKDSSWRHFKDVTYAAYFTDTSTGRTEQRRFDLRITKEPIHVYVLGDTRTQSAGLPLEFYVSTFYADGTPAQCDVFINQGSDDDEETEVPEKNAPGKRIASLRTNAYGLAKMNNLKPPRDKDGDEVHLRFSARDARGAVGHRNESFDYRDTPGIRVTTAKSLYRPQEPLAINIVSTEKDLRVIVDVSKEMQVIRSEMVRLRDGRGSINIPYDERFQNEIRVAAYADIAPREYVSDSHSVFYPYDQNLKLNVLPGKETYRPGEEAHINFNVSAASGKTLESVLGVVIFDRAVEERARTDREFGSGAGFYGNYGSLLGWDESLAGVTKKSLETLDLSKPQTEDFYLLAEILLNRYGYYSPNVFGGDDYELSLETIFTKLTTAQLKPVLDVISARYVSRLEHPSGEAELRRILSESGVNFDSVLDPWGTPYGVRFSVENERDVLKLKSAGADKRFETEDDLLVGHLTWPYFRPTGEAIDRAVKNYHARTRGYIRNLETLKAELRREGIELDTLRDRWGQPFVVEFDVMGVHYVINVTSTGANRALDSHLNFTVDGLMNLRKDDFLIWSSRIDYLAERRAEIDIALNSYLRETRRFPQDMKALRGALHRAKIDFDALRDPWGRAYYATFRQEARYADRVNLQSSSPSGGTSKTQIKPVTQSVGIVKLRSAGADGKEGTVDDFDVGIFTLVISEQGSNDAKTKRRHASMLLKRNGGGITGTVIDPNGAVIAKATVTATLTATEQAYETTTDDNGRYILNLLPGTYQLRVTAPGFQETVIESLVVSKSTILTLDITLQAGAVSETVSVVSDRGSALETSSGKTGQSNFQLDGINLSDTRLKGVSAVTKSGGAVSTPRLREYFPETLVWQPLLETDAQGRAELRFKLADNITTWKLSVIGSTANGEIGIAEKEILAFQPFFVEHDPPRILTEGDEIRLPIVLRNYLDKPQAVDLEMKTENWFALLGAARARAEVAPGDNARHTFDFRAVASVKDGKQRVTATGAEVSDQIEKPVSVHPDGEEIAKTTSGILGDNTTLEADIPANVIKGTSRVELKIYPSLMAHVVESIEAIMERPYGCAEQTISAAYPSLLALRAGKRTRVEPSIAAKARRYVQAGYERLLNYRASDGGFSYWGRGEADLALTAYALRFLHEAQEFIEVDRDVLREAREWLIKHQQEDGSWTPPRFSWEKSEDKRRAAFLTAYVTRILAMTGKKEAAEKASGDDDQTRKVEAQSLKRALLYLSERYREIDEPYLIASYALVSLDMGERERARDAVMKLSTLAHEEAGANYWALETNTPFYGWGRAGRIETTALVVQALNKYCGMRISDCGREDTAKDRVSPNPKFAIRISQLIERGLLFLLREQDRYGVWYSTQATVNTLDALVTLLTSDSPASTESGRAEVFVNDRLATTIKMPPGEQLSTPLIADISQFVSPGSNRIEIRRGANKARASVQVVSTYYVPWAKRKAAHHAGSEDAARALRLNVTYDREAGRAGEEITCKVTAERVGFSGYGMMLAEIGLPPGADVDRASLERAMKESGWSLSQYDVLPDRLIVYLWPQAGGTNFVFKFRPRFGITAQTAPSLLYDYYNPEARVVVAPTKFTIR
jgi:A-macroglobulin TED domain/Alpha-2-macroglobulin family/Carboxypeptidase regulatory-like domain/MG2 domain/A-macroglobulin receptor binding domain/Alpha-2-macroglobulin bait region domain/Macroglobulin domain MG3